jgi:polysaccharide export outer membrane protein
MFSYRPIFIRGAVRQTGSFPFTEGLTVGKAIALAGGTKNSAKPNGVSILREGEVIEQALSIDSQAEVQSGDVISIEEEFGVQEDDASYVYLHGEVASPGEYKFRRGLTVEKAIVLAGGFTLRGARNKISVTRYADIDDDQEPDKLKKVKLYMPIKPGDIINVGATWF